MTMGLIPARMASSRFPGKPLVDIHGLPMLAHCYLRSRLSPALDEVYIATCDEEIAAMARKIGAPCIMTANTHERASDRIAEAMLTIEAETGRRHEIVVLIQGDEPMITPGMVAAAVEGLQDDPSVDVVNLMAPIKEIADFEDPNEVKVVVDRKGYALYFSREPIPSRRKGVTEVPMLKQVCIIPFRRDYLLTYNDTPPTPLEIIESVDMMRILENGSKVRMVMTDVESYSVDTPQDLERVRAAMEDDPMMQRYGEIIGRG